MMSYLRQRFLTEEESKLLVILQENVKENYHVFCKVRLSEFLYSSQKMGSSEFFNEFEIVNSITLPFAIYDTFENQLVAVISYIKPIEKSNLLENQDIKVIHLTMLKDALTNGDLSMFYSDSF
ncbi:TPA: DNA distortion polypeptide 3 [Providencia alcalifaciens]|nr:DNA distortion polypeptide 3 [Providencia alcalifaciens]